MLICIETHITFDFSGGGGGVRTPYPPSGSGHDSMSVTLLIEHHELPRHKGRLHRLI